MASTLETNKALAALLTAGVIASGAGVMSRIIYNPEIPEEPAYRIEVATAEDEGGAAPAEEAVPFDQLLVSADVAGGESVAKKCTACHSFEEGGANKIGPALWGVVGSDIASVEGFDYSEALLAAEGDWDYEALNGFLEDPKGWAPGTKMAFAGVSDDPDRADLVVYLRSLSDDPVPLPEVEAPADEDAGAAEEVSEEPPAAEEDAVEGEQVAVAEEDAATEEPAATEADAAEQGAAAETAVADEEGAETETAAAVDEASAEQETAEDATAEDATAEDATGGEDVAAEATAGAEAAAEEEVAALEAEGSEAADAPADDGIGALLASADAAAGEKAARKCAACHSFDQGGPNKIGPALWGVVGRDIAAADGYSYSDALAGKDGAWDYQALNQYLENPKEWAPGTKMAFAGVRKAEERADIILYLRALAEDPEPLP